MLKKLILLSLGLVATVASGVPNYKRIVNSDGGRQRTVDIRAYNQLKQRYLHNEHLLSGSTKQLKHPKPFKGTHPGSKPLSGKDRLQRPVHPEHTRTRSKK